MNDLELIEQLKRLRFHMCKSKCGGCDLCKLILKIEARVKS